MPRCFSGTAWSTYKPTHPHAAAATRHMRRYHACSRQIDRAIWPAALYRLMSLSIADRNVIIVLLFLKTICLGELSPFSAINRCKRGNIKAEYISSITGLKGGWRSGGVRKAGFGISPSVRSLRSHHAASRLPPVKVESSIFGASLAQP